MQLKLLNLFVTLCLKLRYRIQVKGIETIETKDGKGILFMPNHPALIDPAIIGSILIRRFHPYILIDEQQVRETSFLQHYSEELHLLPMADPGKTGQSSLESVHAQFHECLKTLQSGHHLLMYPSGHIYHSRYESMRGNTGAHYLISQCPDIRIVLIRTKGLWGSSFSRSCGFQRPFMDILKDNVKYLFRNLIFFMPRRPVEITFQEMGAEFPRKGTKEEINLFLEQFYNTDAPGNTYVPYSFFDKGGIRTIAEPPSEDAHVDTSEVPADVREKVFRKLKETASVSGIRDQDRLGADLGMDSLMVSELLVWIQQEFGYSVSSPDKLKSVANVLLAAIGQTVNTDQLRPVPASWFLPANPELLAIPKNCTKITDTFLKLAAKQPDYPLLADQNSGVLTNRKIILSILALKDIFASLPGERIGIIMPACAPFFVIFMATLFAGKVPVILNWTVGPRNLDACVRKSGVTCILSSQLVIEQLQGRGTDFSAIKDKIVYLEDLKSRISGWTKLSALFQAYFCWHSLRSAKVPENLAILFTSGSESEPKAVPLTHLNGMSDIEYAMTPMKLRKDDCILGMLPPFHSFGLLIGAILPALSNMRIVFHSNPTEGNLLAKIIGAYQPSMIVGTPTFADGILRNATREEVKTIRIIITGAEKCPQGVLDLCREKCPKAVFLEGYGITECGPIVAVNQPDACKPGTIGKILSCTDAMVCAEDGQKLPPNQTGMLFISGPTIFHGYLAYDGASPFVERDGKLWYRTGDLVQIDEEGYVTFKGRLKRFIKIAGEMVSLPAIEDVLLNLYKEQSKGIPLAVEAQGPDNAPEIILFTVLELDKNTVNQQLREAGFSPIHYVKRVVKMAEIPLLGTGKTDYRALKKMA